MARWRNEYTIEEADDVLCVAAIDPFPFGFGNSAIPLGSEAHPDPEGLIAKAARFFGTKGRGHTLWVRDHLDADLERLALQSGYQSFSESPGLLLEAPVAAAEEIEGTRIEIVRDLEQAALLGPVVAEGYATVGMPHEASLSFFAQPERLLGSHLIAVLGYWHDRPVATAFAILNHGVAGVYWVATDPAARGHGLCDACTRVLSNRAFELGAGAVYLQASSQGDPIYRRMGYREITRYRWLFKPAAAA